MDRKVLGAIEVVPTQYAVIEDLHQGGEDDLVHVGQEDTTVRVCGESKTGRNPRPKDQLAFINGRHG